MFLSEVFDRRANALNAVRLALAASVVFIHSFSLTGSPLIWGPLDRLLGDVGVDGFFAISGFLIVSSWVNRPQVVAFMKARILRIFPAFYVCLLVTAFVLAPLSMWLAGSWSPGWFKGAVTYVTSNSGLWIFQTGIPGTLETTPHPLVWDLPLWTLAWEFLCYLAVLALGVLGWLNKQWILWAGFAACWVGLFFCASGIVDSGPTQSVSRFGLMFVTGALAYFLQDRIRMSWKGVGVAALVIAGSSFLPDYRLVAAPFVAYVCIGVGALIKDRRLSLRNDFSYGLYIYAFPVQQMLAVAGLAILGPIPFAAVALVMSLPIAALSWFVIEKPALSLKDMSRRPAPVTGTI